MGQSDSAFVSFRQGENEYVIAAEYVEHIHVTKGAEGQHILLQLTYNQMPFELPVDEVYGVTNYEWSTYHELPEIMKCEESSMVEGVFVDSQSQRIRFVVNAKMIINRGE